MNGWRLTDEARESPRQAFRERRAWTQLLGSPGPLGEDWGETSPEEATEQWFAYQFLQDLVPDLEALHEGHERASKEYRLRVEVLAEYTHEFRRVLEVRVQYDAGAMESGSWCGFRVLVDLDQHLLKVCEFQWPGLFLQAWFHPEQETHQLNDLEVAMAWLGGLAKDGVVLVVE